MTIEGGPTLTIPFDGGTELEIGVFGVDVDFVHGSPIDEEVSSQNRDLVGQRVLVALTWSNDWVHGRVEALYMRDDAKGDAFDSRGGAVAGRLNADLGDGLWLSTGLGATVREFGPIGEQAILRGASTRTEVRLSASLGARVRINEQMSVVIDDVYLRNTARAGHEYTDNVISFGVEAQW